MKRRWIMTVMAVTLLLVGAVYAQDGGSTGGAASTTVKKPQTPAERIDHVITGGEQVEQEILKPEDIPDDAKPPAIPGDDTPETPKPAEAAKPVEAAKPAEATKPAETPEPPAPDVPEAEKTLTSHTEPLPAESGVKTETPKEAPLQEKLPPPAPVEGATELPAAETPQKDKMVFAAHQQMTTPRATVQYLINHAYTQDYKRAALTLDFSKQPEMSDGEKEDLAFKMYNILLRLDGFVSQRVPAELEDDICYIRPDERFRAIVLRKSKGVWRFTPETVAYIPQFYADIQDKPPVALRLWMKYVPAVVFTRFAGLMYAQWAVIGGFLLLGIVVYRIAPRILSYLVLLPLRNMRKDEKFVGLTRRAIRPLAYLAVLYIWFAGFRYVQLPPQMLKIVGWIIHPIGILLMMVAVMRMTDIFGQWMRNHMQRAQNKVGNALADLITNALKVLFVCIGVIGVAQVYGFSAIGILSGMGIGGIAVALAAQNTVANFFGSLMILMDRPFTIGDYIITDKIEGVVETIGLRSTRIRTFYNSLIVIPNSVLAAATIDNMERRYFRRYRTFLTIQYGTPVAVLEEFCKRVTDIIMSYPDSKKSGVQVYVTDLADWSINILLNCHFAASTSNEEYTARQRLNFDILRLAEEMGIVFASSTDRQVTGKLGARSEEFEH